MIVCLHHRHREIGVACHYCQIFCTACFYLLNQLVLLLFYQTFGMDIFQRINPEKKKKMTSKQQKYETIHIFKFVGCYQILP